MEEGSTGAPAGGGWFDEQEPHDPALAAAQEQGLLQWLGPPPRRVLDLGCGAGRMLIPLAQAGHQVIGLDRDEEVLEACRRRLGESQTRLAAVDFMERWPEDLGLFDAVCCLGNTMMEVVELDAAVALLRRAAAALHPGGAFIMDDCPHLFWPELVDGHWQRGVSEDGLLQMVWAEGEVVFALRRGAAIDPASWQPRAGDRRFRLWTLDLLRLAGALAGLSAIEPISDAGLLIMRRGAG
jgi:SAM-dependent methyltransferase